MSHPTAVGGPRSAAEILRSAPRERRNVFNPLTCAVIGLVAFVCGIVAILDARPFASTTASERVSTAVGNSASCGEIGTTILDGTSAAVYRCSIGSGENASWRCFAIADGQVRQIVGSSRRLRC